MYSPPARPFHLLASITPSSLVMTTSSSAPVAPSSSPSMPYSTTANCTTKSVSQILADSLLDSSSAASSSNRPAGPSGDIPSAKQIALRARYNRRVSFDDAAAADVEEQVAESRRLSYNDAPQSISMARRYHSCRQHNRRYSTTSSSAATTTSSLRSSTSPSSSDGDKQKRVSFSEDLSSTCTEEEEEEEDDDEGYVAFATVAAAGAKAKDFKSRKLQHQTRRRLSYNDALEYASSLDSERSRATSIMKTVRRRHTMGDALDYDDDDYDDENCDSEKQRPHRRVSFSNDLVSSVHEIPHITKLQKREMFYRKREIKQFRLDSWLEQAMVISDEQHTCIDRVSQAAPFLPTTSNVGQSPSDSTSTTSVSPRKNPASSLPLRRTSNSRRPPQRRPPANSTSTSFPQRTSNSTSDGMRDTGGEHHNESAEVLKDALRESMSQIIRGAVQRVDPTPTREVIRTATASTNNDTSSHSDSFFTSSDIMSAAVLAASNASSSTSAEEKIGDWTESLRVCTRSRIDAAISGQSISSRSRGLSTNSSSSVPPEVSFHRRGKCRHARTKRRHSIEAPAA